MFLILVLGALFVAPIAAQFTRVAPDLSPARFFMGVGSDANCAVFAAGSTQNKGTTTGYDKFWPQIGSGTKVIDIFRSASATSNAFQTLNMAGKARFGMACAGGLYGQQSAVLCGGGGDGNEDFADGFYINSTLAEEQQGNYSAQGVMRAVQDFLSESRSYAAATTNGRFVLFAGGMLSSTTYNNASVTAAVEIYMLDSFAAGRVDATLSVARTAVSAASAGQLSFFAGGFVRNGSPVDTVDIWQRSTNSWSIDTLSIARGGTHGAVASGIVNPPIIVFVAGGANADISSPLRTTDLFTLYATGIGYNKTRGSDLNRPVQRSGILGGFDDGRVIMWGGTTALTNGAIDDGFSFSGTDPTSAWVQTASALTVSRRDVACIRTGFKVIVGAGQDDSGPSGRIDIADYSPSSSTTGVPVPFTTESATTFEISTTGTPATTSVATTASSAALTSSVARISTSTSSISTGSPTTSATATNSTNFGSTSSSPPDNAVASIFGSADAFPVWIIASAAGTCLCCFLVGALVILRRRRVNTGDGDNDHGLEMNDDAPAAFDDNEESNYDRIASGARDKAQYQSAIAVVAAAEGAYARIPSMPKVVEGNYAQIPQLQQNSAFSDAVAVLSVDEVMLDVSRRVGKGSFGDVFRGMYRGVDVAVKMLKNEFTPTQLQSFYVEAEVIAAVPPHEFIVGFLGVTPSPFMILTEFCGQGSLKRFLRSANSVQMSTAQSLKLVADVAEGMRHLSSYGIIHRDLAARNVLLTNNLTPKIADFGMSCKIEVSQSFHHSKSATGPVRWMSVECIRKGIFSEASDVWSFAVFVYEVFSRGSTPYGPEVANMEVVRKVLAGHRLVFPDVFSSSLVNLFKLCMHADPNKRPTFAAIVEKLDEEADAGEIVYADLSTLGTLQGQTGTNGTVDLNLFRE